MVRPEYERMGIGRKLHDIMLNWYFSQTREKVWLGTWPKTRADRFYRIYGWKEAGKQPNGEMRFELTFDDWKNNSLNQQIIRKMLNLNFNPFPFLTTERLFLRQVEKSDVNEIFFLRSDPVYEVFR